MDTDQLGRGRREHVSATDAVLGVVELDLPSRLDLVTVARMVAAAAAGLVGTLEGERLDDLRWVTSEAVTNAVKANLETDEPGRVRLRIEVHPDKVAVEVSDDGPGMPPSTPMPEMDDPERLLTEGGFGIPLMQMLTSEPVVFTTGAGGTTVELVVRP